MGICGSNAAPKPEAEKSKNIQTALQNDRDKSGESDYYKLLLLGAGESGKSTIAKQIKIIHMKGFSDEERASFKSIIYNNAIGSMRALVTAAKDLGLELDARVKKHAENVCIGEEYFTGDLTSELANDIKNLWADPGIREAFARSAEFQLNDCAAYYFDHIERIAKPDYLPTEQDLLRSRAKTTGIIELCFTMQNVNFKLVDVGGQRSERKKWMHCFQDVTAVIFCVAMSEYDLKLYEDDSTNRMHESLKLFREISNNKWFVDTAMILFLNKKDLFEEKIKKVDLKVCFPEYTGGCNYEAASTYIRNQFCARNENSKKSVYPHITCATDTQNIQHVFNAVKDIVIGQAVMSSDLF